MCPEAITSEVFVCPGVQSVIDARKLPRAIVMTDVMHHIADAERFLAEAQRALVPGGRILNDRALGQRLVEVRVHAVAPRAVSTRGLGLGILPERACSRLELSRMKGLERLLAPLMGQLAMFFAFIAVERR